MKPKHSKKVVTFGEFIQSAYAACGKRKGTGIVRLAVNSRLLDFRGGQRLFISDK